MKMPFSFTHRPLLQPSEEQLEIHFIAPRFDLEGVAKEKNSYHCLESNLGRPARSLITIPN
jgi:hypothetical protein